MRPALSAALLICFLPSSLALPPYGLQESYLGGGGTDFFSKWDFWAAADPSNGSVEYVDQETAIGAGVASATASQAYLGVDMVSTVAKRKSVRIQSKAVYNAGLFVADVQHAPTGCGTWPAFWLYGEDDAHRWPAWGEYDIIEGVHDDIRTLTTLHTAAECQQSQIRPGEDFTETWGHGTSSLPASNCDVNAPGQWKNQGCSQAGPQGSMGSSFNAGGGGTFAAEWDPEAGHIRAWFWPRGMEPGDLKAKNPEPESWGMPYSFFSLDPASCSSDHFQNMRVVFNINLCGDLGAAKYVEGCPEEAKTMTCEELVADPDRMQEAFWMLSGLDVYARGATTAAPPSEPSPGSPWIFADFGVPSQQGEPLPELPQPQPPVQPEQQNPAPAVARQPVLAPVPAAPTPPPAVPVVPPLGPPPAPMPDAPPARPVSGQDLMKAKSKALGGERAQSQTPRRGDSSVQIFGVVALIAGVACIYLFTNLDRHGDGRQGILSAVSVCWGRLSGRCKVPDGLELTEILRSQADRMDAMLETVGQFLGLVDQDGDHRLESTRLAALHRREVQEDTAAAASAKRPWSWGWSPPSRDMSRDSVAAALLPLEDGGLPSPRRGASGWSWGRFGGGGEAVAMQDPEEALERDGAANDVEASEESSWSGWPWSRFRGISGSTDDTSLESTDAALVDVEGSNRRQKLEGDSARGLVSGSSRRAQGDSRDHLRMGLTFGRV